MTSLQCVFIFIKYSLITACLASVNEVFSDIAVDIVRGFTGFYVFVFIMKWKLGVSMLIFHIFKDSCNVYQNKILLKVMLMHLHISNNKPIYVRGDVKIPSL